MSNYESLKVFSGNSNKELSDKIAKKIGIPIGKALVGRFSDGEVQVELHEDVRGKDVFVIQSTCKPTDENLMELLILVDALKRSSAARVTTVIPYFGYSRQDRRVRSMRVPISAKVVANLISTVGTDRLLTVDLHSDQEQGFFDIPVDNLYAAPVITKDILDNYKNKDLVIISPDVGGVVRARGIAKRINGDLAIVDKRRDKANESEVMNIIGNIKDRDCIIVDDIVDTAGTLCNAAEALIKSGAKSVSAYITHGVLSGPAIERLKNSKLNELVITDSIAPTKLILDASNIRILNLAPLVAEAIKRISSDSSVSSLFD